MDSVDEFLKDNDSDVYEPDVEIDDDDDDDIEEEDEFVEDAAVHETNIGYLEEPRLVFTNLLTELLTIIHNLARSF